MRIDGPVLVTGGTGSFGSTMVRHLLRSGAEEVRILSRDEAKQDDLRRELDDPRARFYLGDVRDYSSVEDAATGVAHVFHAAALKQVPSCEFFPQQAVATNVLGSDNVIRAAERRGVDSVVCLSTDKAVYPVNAMGISKAMMEKVALSYARRRADGSTAGGPRVAITRYGNVMCSRGSVIPVFLDQMRKGCPLTVTDPSMTRFLMSLDESVSLVEHAFESAQSGDLLVRKAPASTVGDLARAVASLFGVDDPRIRVLGTRHGEKQSESLLSREELCRAEDQGSYFRVPLDARSLDYGSYHDAGVRTDVEQDYNSSSGHVLTVPEIRALLLTLAPVRRALVDAGRAVVAA